MLWSLLTGSKLNLSSTLLLLYGQISSVAAHSLAPCLRRSAFISSAFALLASYSGVALFPGVIRIAGKSHFQRRVAYGVTRIPEYCYMRGGSNGKNPM